MARETEKNFRDVRPPAAGRVDWPGRTSAALVLGNETEGVKSWGAFWTQNMGIYYSVYRYVDVRNIVIMCKVLLRCRRSETTQYHLVYLLYVVSCLSFSVTTTNCINCRPCLFCYKHHIV